MIPFLTHFFDVATLYMKHSFLHYIICLPNLLLNIFVLIYISNINYYFKFPDETGEEGGQEELL